MGRSYLQGSPWHYEYDKEPVTKNKRASVSCSKCINYCKEDKSCNIKPIYCPVDGWNYWKQCDSFVLANQYRTPETEKLVSRIKGDRKPVIEKSKTIVENKKDVGDEKSEQNKSNKTKNEQISAYEEKEIINRRHFINSVTANIMIIAIRKKKDIYNILEECERAMESDFRTKPSAEQPWSFIPKVELSLIFLSMVAERLECNLHNFFIDNEDSRRKFVYELIENKDIQSYVFLDDLEDGGSASFSISNFDYFYGMTKESPHDICRDMELCFERNVLDDGGFYYTVSFGDWRNRKINERNYLSTAAYLLEEERGKLKDFIEKLIREYS